MDDEVKEKEKQRRRRTKERQVVEKLKRINKRERKSPKKKEKEMHSFVLFLRIFQTQICKMSVCMLDYTLIIVLVQSYLCHLTNQLFFQYYFCDC